MAAAQLERDWASYFGNRLTGSSRVAYDGGNKVVYIGGTTADSVGIGAGDVYMSTIPSQITPGAPPVITQWNHYAFIAKFDDVGALQWSTYYGGDGKDRLFDMVIDHAGNILIVGTTTSTTGIANASSWMTAKSEDTCSFLAKFSPTGALLWSTYLPDRVYEVTINNDNEILVAGMTDNATGIATAGTFQSSYGGNWDNFILKFDPDGNRIWGTYIGGNGYEDEYAIATDNLGNVYLVQYGDAIDSADFSLGTAGVEEPTPSYLEPMYGDGGSMGYQSNFLIKLNPSGNRVWATYISAPTSGSLGYLAVNMRSITVDAAMNVYLAGKTYNPYNVATPGAYDTTLNNADLFLMKYNASGHKVWGTYFGGESDEAISGSEATTSFFNTLTLKPDGSSLFLSGYTFSVTGISSTCSYPPPTEGRRGVIANFDTTGQLIMSSYYDEGISSLTVAQDDTSSNGYSLYLTGLTSQAGLGTAGTYMPSLDAVRSNFLTKLSINCPSNNSIPLSNDSAKVFTTEGYAYYKWYRNDTFIADANDAFYYFDMETLPAWFTVKAIDSCGCNYYSNSIYIDSASLSIDYNPSHNNVRLFPNPAQDVINFQISDDGTTISRDDAAEVFNNLGIMLPVPYKKVNENTIQMDISSLPKGMYYIRFLNTVGKFTKL